MTEATRRAVDTAGTAGEKLASAAAAAGLAAVESGNISGVASDIAGAAVEQGKQLLESAKGHATGFADMRKNDAAQSISDLASSLRETGKSFEERPNIKALVGTAADGLEQFADGLRERNFTEIYSDIEAYARHRPLAVGAATVVAGFFLARFIKSSSEELAAGAQHRANAPTRRAATAHSPTAA